MNDSLRTQWREKLLSLAALAFALELVFFKFLPDISTAIIQKSTSNLTDFGVFEREYMVPGKLFYTRFLGNHILWYLARFLSHFVHSPDIRLHPLRLAAAILTPVYAFAGAGLALRRASDLDWRYFMAAYALSVVVAQYLFYPSDMPAFAALSVALYFLLRERLGMALVFMLLTGLFREAAFHVVAWVGLWMLVSRSKPVTARLAWTAVFAAAFVIEYLAVRHYFPGPLTGSGRVEFDPRVIFLDQKTLSLTAICSVGLEVVFALACLNRLRNVDRAHWPRRFFMINCYGLPGWLIFYRMMGGNLSEFRMLLPAVLPCIYGVAFSRVCNDSTAVRSGLRTAAAPNPLRAPTP